MKNLSRDNKQFILRVVIIAGCGMFVGFLWSGSSIFTSTNMAFQFTANSIAAGLSYALFKRTSVLNSFLVLFCWFLILTFVEEFNNRWMYVLNVVYTAGIASVIYVYILFVDKKILHNTIRRVLGLTGAIATINVLHVLVLVLISLGLSWIHYPRYVSSIYSSCLINLRIGAINGFGVALGIEIVDYFLSQRALAALKSWMLDANGS
jgi:hypothetical protein